jgi:hypothetical protein
MVAAEGLSTQVNLEPICKYLRLDKSPFAKGGLKKIDLVLFHVIPAEAGIQLFHKA